MKISFLGTNGWYDTKTGNTVCTVVETKKYLVVLDAGTGFHKLDNFVAKNKKPVYVFLSHFHFDHIIGLYTLPKFDFPNGLNIFGKTGTKSFLKKVMELPYAKAFKDLPFKIKVGELPKDSKKVPFPIVCKELIHVSPCIGFRLKIDGKEIAYCTDTGPCKNFDILAKNADVLISECSLRPGQNCDEWMHLSPEWAATAAKRCNVKNLVLTHFDAYKYLNLAERRKSLKEAKKIFPKTTLAFDGGKFEI